MRFGRKGSKTVLLSLLLSVYIHGTAGMVLPGLNIHICKVILVIVDLLYLWQLGINEAAMCSSILFNSPRFQFYLICLLSLLYLSTSGRIM